MKPVPRNVVEATWREWRAKKQQRRIAKHDARVRGVNLVMELDGKRKLEFRGRHYGVPPVPWVPAVRWINVQNRYIAIRASKTPDLAEYDALATEVADLFKLCVRPESLVERLLWRWKPSPALNASPQEVGHLLGFFYTFRRQDEGESLEAIASSLRHAISRSNSAGSSPTSLVGATNGAGH